MGSRELIIFLLFTMIFSTCHANKNVSISNCVITENSIIIDIDFKSVRIFRIKEVGIDYKNIPVHIWFSEEDEITYAITDSKCTAYAELAVFGASI